MNIEEAKAELTKGRNAARVRGATNIAQALDIALYVLEAWPLVLNTMSSEHDANDCVGAVDALKEWLRDNPMPKEK